MRLAGCSAHPKGRGSPKNAIRLRACLFARVGRLYYLDRTYSEIPRCPTILPLDPVRSLG